MKNQAVCMLYAPAKVLVLRFWPLKSRELLDNIKKRDLAVVYIMYTHVDNKYQLSSLCFDLGKSYIYH